MERVPGHLPRSTGSAPDVIPTLRSDLSEVRGSFPEPEESSSPDLVAWRIEPPAKHDSAKAVAPAILLPVISPGFE